MISSNQASRCVVTKSNSGFRAKTPNTAVGCEARKSSIDAAYQALDATNVCAGLLTAKLLFTRSIQSKQTVFVDGCFWHGCPVHGTQPRQNATFWREKIARNRSRDRRVDRELRARGWRVLRIWEHALKRRGERRLLARLEPALGRAGPGGSAPRRPLPAHSVR